MSNTASERAADRIHADLEAMIADADRHARGDESGRWLLVRNKLREARAAVTLCMCERDRRIAGG